VQFEAPDDGQKNRLQHVGLLTGISELRKVASCWLYSENILAMHGLTDVKKLVQHCSISFRCVILDNKMERADSLYSQLHSV